MWPVTDDLPDRLARFTRAAVLDTLGGDHVRAARAKGLSDGQVVWRHGLPGALVPVVTAMGLVAGGLLAGDVVIETIFSWPGMGQLGVAAIRSRDYPVIAGFALYAGVAFALVNIVIDLVCALLDPRLRLGDPAEEPA